VSAPAPTGVVGILTVSGAYALQHRDDLPGIALRGMWSLWAGGMMPGETPARAIRREVYEELSLDVSDWRELWRLPFREDHGDQMLVIYDADVTAVWPQHKLNEGQECGLFAADALPRPMHRFVEALIHRHDEMTRLTGARAPEP
jgi:8-oxo-dGTP pyrophosphatase MutT (NUDIX family)